MALLRVIREPAYALTWAGLSFLVFDLCLYLMITLTGSRDNMCMQGANFTPENVVFSILLSLGFGLIMTVLLYTLRTHLRIGAGVSLLGTIGSIIGFLTLFCGICSFSVVTSIFFSLGLGFVSFESTERFMNSFMSPVMEWIVDNNMIVKIACLAMVGLTLWLLNRRMNEGWACKIK